MNKCKKLQVIMSIVAIMCTVLLCSCGQDGNTPKDVTGKLLDGIKAQDKEAVENYYAGDKTMLDDNYFDDAFGKIISSTQDGYTSQMFNTLRAKLVDFDYKVLEENINGDSASVKVQFTTYEFGNKAKNIYDNVTAAVMSLNNSNKPKSGQTIYQAVEDALTNLGDKTMKSVSTINLSKSGKKWMVDQFSQKTLDAMSGNLYTTVHKLN